jgi:hypothetical protein
MAQVALGSLAVLFVATPAHALDPQDAAAGAKVARKVEKAKAKAKEEGAEHDREALAHMKHKIDDYVELHRKEFARLGAKESAETQEKLAVAIVARRARARQGDVFLPEVQALLRQRLAEQLKGPDALAARKAVAEGNPGDEDPVPVTVKVNGRYPLGASRSTVPASVLITLPVLPDCLHYRFVGRDLVLVDAVAQIIVDFLPGSAPAGPAK